MPVSGNKPTNKYKTILLEDPKALEYILEKGKAVEEGRKIQKQIEELAEQQNKLALRSMKFQEKLQPMITKAIKSKLEEFEVATTLTLTKDNKLEIKIVNAVDEFKAEYLSKK